MKNTTSLIEENEHFFKQKAVLDSFLQIDSPEQFKESLEELYFFWISENPDIPQENRQITTTHFRSLVSLLEGLNTTNK